MRTNLDLERVNYVMTFLPSASRNNKFDVLNMTERGLEVEEVNAIDVAQKIVEITIDSGAAKSA